MKKLSFLCFVLVACPVLANQPIEYFFKISLQNVCSQPIQMEANVLHTADYIGDEETKLNKQTLAVGRSIEIFLALKTFTDLEDVIPDHYALKISSNNKSIIIDKGKFIFLLKKSNYEREGCGFLCWFDYYIGTIRDPSLCPENTAFSGEQRRYDFSISLRNHSGIPVQIEVNPLNIANPLVNERKLEKQTLDDRDVIDIFWGIESFKDIERAVPDYYTLKISAEGKSFIVDKTEFLHLLRMSNYGREKCGLLCWSDHFSGTIKLSTEMLLKYLK